MNNKNKELANVLLNHSVKLQKGENILIEMLGTDCFDLGIELIKQAKEIGANPIFNIIDYKVLREILINCNEGQIKKYAEIDLFRMKTSDAYIGIRSSSNKQLEGIPKKSMEIYNKTYTTPVHFEERVKRTKWCILRYPNEEMAQMAKMNLEKFTEVFYKVCTVYYDNC